MAMKTVAETCRQQLKSTVGIDNLISVPETTANLFIIRKRIFCVILLEQRKIEKVKLAGKDKLVTTSVGEKFMLPALIIAQVQELAKTECSRRERLYRAWSRFLSSRRSFL